MMFELIYTSYPRGLQSGTSGFTSVAYTEGMPKTYIQLCESLSGYPFIYSLGHPMYEQNPEIYSHYRFNVTGEEISILSRVAVSGRDYTGRENKIAHHIVLEQNERLQCIDGPAWLMIHANLFVEQWDQAPCLLQPKKIDLSIIDVNLSIPDNEHRLSKQWKTIFSNCDPALILAKSAEYNLKIPSLKITSMEMPSFILFDPEDENLPYKKMCLNLLAEALTLVTPEKRWEISFNTYFVSKPMDSDCMWRCCPIQSQLSQILPSQHNNFNYALNLIEKYPESLVIDLTRKTIYGKPPFNRETESSKAEAIENSMEPLSEPDFQDSDIVSSDKALPPENPFLSEHHQEGRSNAHSTQRISKKITDKIGFWIILSIAVLAGAGFLYILLPNNTLHIKSNNTLHIKSNNTLYIKNNTSSIEAGISKNKQGKREATASPESITSTLTQTNGVQNEISQIKNNKKMVLSFYENIHNMVSDFFSDTEDFKNMKCTLVRNDGTEVDVDIESPIAGDTPNWDIVLRDTKESVGEISMQNISLYDKGLYSAIFLDIPSRKHTDLIWTGAIKMVPLMLSKGAEPDTLEIRFAPEMSELLQKVLSLLSSNNLVGVVELKQTEQNQKFAQESSKQAEDALKQVEKDSQQVEENSNKDGDNLKQVEENPKQLEDKLIFNPAVSLEIGKNEDMTIYYIKLKFTSDDFKAIFNNIHSESKNHIQQDNPFANNTLTSETVVDMGNTNFKESRFKEFRIDYIDHQHNKKYPVLCFPCKTN